MRNYVNNCEEYMNGKGHSDFQMLEKESSFNKYISSVPNFLNRFNVINDTVTTTLKKDVEINVGEPISWELDEKEIFKQWCNQLEKLTKYENKYC